MGHNWDDIRYFLALCRNDSFVAAAHELKVTHSTVARRITALESNLQTQLFIRTGQGCKLSLAGEQLLPFAEKLESIMLGLEETTAGKNQQLTGTVRIGTPDGIGNMFLASRLGQFQESHPSLEFELIPVPRYYSLAKREIDISITVQKPKTGNVITRKLTEYKFGLFATRGYLERHDPIQNREDLKRHSIVGYIDELLFDDDLHFMNEICPGLKPSFRISTVIGQINAIAGGSGIGLIPYFLAHPITSLVPVLPEISIERAFWLQVNPDSRQLARVRSTIDFIVEQIELNISLFQTHPAIPVQIGSDFS